MEVPSHSPTKKPLEKTSGFKKEPPPDNAASRIPPDTSRLRYFSEEIYT